ncbi:MAG: type II toxin-antitoxin system VapC family toxin [Gemmatimonadales bacterium]|nr:type II toxin-antitoxin system VapC family toxin [Gemmatimonadales bacterium]
MACLQVRGAASRDQGGSGGRSRRRRRTPGRIAPAAGQRARRGSRSRPLGEGRPERTPGGACRLSPRMIHLDTSFLILALDAGSPQSRELNAWLHAGVTLGMSAVAWTEFLCGPLSTSQLATADSIVGPRADYTGADAAVAAQLFNETGRRRGTLRDCMIAAVALRDGARLATGDEADFRRFEPLGLKLA